MNSKLGRIHNNDGIARSRWRCKCGQRSPQSLTGARLRRRLQSRSRPWQDRWSTAELPFLVRVLGREIGVVRPRQLGARHLCISEALEETERTPEGFHDFGVYR